MKTDWTTWSPFQSAEVREICAHMTDSEEGEALRRSCFYGLWAGATFAVPFGMALTLRNPVHVATAAALIIIHIICIPIWQRMQRNFLCSTSWAREQGVTPAQLRLFSFRG